MKNFEIFSLLFVFISHQSYLRSYLEYFAVRRHLHSCYFQINTSSDFSVFVDVSKCNVLFLCHFSLLLTAKTVVIIIPPYYFTLSWLSRMPTCVPKSKSSVCHVCADRWQNRKVRNVWPGMRNDQCLRPVRGVCLATRREWTFIDGHEPISRYSCFSTWYGFCYTWCPSNTTPSCNDLVRSERCMIG